MSNDNSQNLPPSFAPRSPRQRPKLTPSSQTTPNTSTGSSPSRSQPASIAPRNPQKSMRPNTTTRSTARRASHAPAAVQPRRPSPAQNFVLPDVNNPETPRTAPQERKQRNKTSNPFRKGLKITGILLIILLVISLVWCFYVYNYANKKFIRTPALSNMSATTGTTYLLAGSDRRTHNGIWDNTEGARTDSILLIHIPSTGNPSIISLPRDSAVTLPNGNVHKLNSAYAYGGPKELVQTVEKITHLHVDHYIEIGMGGIKNLVDAVDGVELCYSENVDDADSQLHWKAGCHTADGNLALAFSRMRMADPRGDLGRSLRQQQVIKQVMKKALSFKYFLPWNTLGFIDKAAPILTLDKTTSVYQVYNALKGLQQATEHKLTGLPPIANPDAYNDNLGSYVQLDQEKGKTFWNKVANGSITEKDFQ